MPLPRRLYLQVREWFAGCGGFWGLQGSMPGAYIGFASFHAHHARDAQGQGWRGILQSPSAGFGSDEPQSESG